jgi:pimeloyl-ACP methyl ester carboxylesterase
MLRTVRTSTLCIGFEELGPTDGKPIVLVHGFPYSPHAYEAVAAPLATHGFRTIAPYLRGFGATCFRDANAMRTGEQAALGCDVLELITALGLKRPLVVGYDWGSRAVCIAAIVAPAVVRGVLTFGAYPVFGPPITTPLDPAVEHLVWYQHFLTTPRGRAMLTANRRGFCRYLWTLWSPTWRFDDATFDATARHYENADFVDVVLHFYRYRNGLAEGDPKLAQLARRLEQRPDITVPATLLRGSEEPSAPGSELGCERFTSSLAYRELPGVGHNTPQEAPGEVVSAVLELDARAP